MPASALRPLTLGELLDRTFFLYRRHFFVVVGIVALPHLLVLALQISSLVQPSVLARLLLSAIGSLLAVVVLAVSQGATVVAVSNMHLGRPATITGAFAAISGVRILKIAWIVIAVGFAIVFGFLLLVVPGILLMLRWSLVVPVAVLEQKPLRKAMRRSAELTAGHRGRVLMIYVLYFILTLAFQSAWQMPIVAGAVFAGRSPATMPLSLQVLLQVGTFLTQSLVGPLLTITLALVYYDERVRKEAFDLEHMLNELDSGAGAPATS